MNDSYSHFHDGLFEDLRHGVMFYEDRSVLCCYFREEKRNHRKVRERKSIYEKTAVYGPPAVPVEETWEEKTWENGEKPVRRSSGRQPAVEILCRYYDFLADYEICRRRRDPAGAAESAEAFLGEMRRLADAAKVGKRRKKPVFEELERMQETYRHERTERLVERIMDLHLYAEAAQFLYNGGYPLPRETEGEYDPDWEKQEKTRLIKLERSRIKTLPMGLLDMYFSRKDLSFQKLSAINRTAPHQVSRNMDMKEEIEEVYRFVCEKEMDTAVVPLLIDNDSGSGLYIIGRAYLKSWNGDVRMRRRVNDILGDQTCCYAIVKFLNLEARLDDTYLWTPYSVVDMVYESCDTNPENILFSDLEKALNIYEGQLGVRSGNILYENFHLVNQLDEEESLELIPPGYRKYFDVPRQEEDMREDIKSLKEEYKVRLKNERFCKKNIDLS